MMNSLEALDRVKTAPQYHGEKSVYLDHIQSSSAFDKDIEIIKQDLEILAKIRYFLREYGCEGYADYGEDTEESNHPNYHDFWELVRYPKASDDELQILEIIKRICSDDSNYINSKFGVNENKFYIDGCTEYRNNIEKQLIKNWLNK